MAISKITLNGVTQIDLTPTTATAADVASGKTFLDAAGVQTTGSLNATANPTLFITAYTAQGDYYKLTGAIDPVAPFMSTDGQANFLLSKTLMGNASASDVVSGKTFTSQDGIAATGSLVVNRYYTGTSTPASSLGNNGDLYLVT